MALDRPPLTLGIVLLLAVAHASARECKFSCSAAPGNLIKLEPGKAYQYDLSGTTATTKPGAKGEVSKLTLSAKVEIVAGANCENVVTLSNVQTAGPDGKGVVPLFGQPPQQEIIKKFNLDSTLGSGPTKFGLQGGKLEELCVDENEALPSLNIKRAAISLLQAAVAKESGSVDVTETDVFGICPTNLDFSKTGNTLTVRKSRDLNRCAGREGVNVPFPTPSYLASSDIQTSALLAGDLKVTQTFENGVLKSAEAQEVYEYNPSGALEAQTKVTVSTKLTLSGSSSKALPAAGKCNSARPVIFDAEHEREFKGTASEITALLKKGSDSKNVDAEDAKVFTSLVNAVSVAPKSEILNVYNQAKAGSGFKEKTVAVKQLKDAIYSSLSASSIEVIAELIKNKEITGAELFLWYLRLGAVKHASRASLTATIPLLDGNAPTSAYLGLGTLGARFCQEHNCEGIKEVEAFQKKLAGPLLTKGCTPASHKDEDQLISSLKGLANMKYLTTDVAAKLGQCLQDQSIKARIRSAVADTIRSDPHKPQVKEAALKVFEDPKEDSELRIKSYLALTGCPCGKVAESISRVLGQANSLQVGSFVVSHLRNIRASTNPDKASAKHHFGGILTSKRYPIDPRKFSQNLEASYSLDLLNVGASADTNVIYSQKSWLPRSLSVNLTAQLYGHAVNFLELDARLENLERVVESLVGPKGYVNTHKPNQIVSKTKNIANGILEKIATRYDKALRPKRSPATLDELAALAKKVNLGVDSDKDVSVDLSLKTFGSEIGWLKLHGADGKTNPDKIIDDVFGKLDEAVNGAKDFNTDYRKHITFANHDVVYPTSLGLALRLKAIGTAAVRVKVDGKLDLPAILKNPKNTDFRLQLIPSAAVDLRGDLTVDGVAVETGVRVSLNIHTSTGTDFTLRLLDGQGVDVKVGLPVKKQEIISVKTDIVSIVKEDGKPEGLKPVSFDVKRETYSGCFDQINPIIGLTFCGKVSTPWEGHKSISTGYGPSELSLSVEKEDDTLNSYHFKIYQLIKDGKASFELLFDTPNSKEDRKVSVVLDAALKPKKYVKLNVHSPWTSAEVDGTIIETDKEVSASAKLNHDGAEYVLKAGAKKSKNGKQLKLEPIFEYKAPEIKSSLIGRRTGPKGPQQAYSASGVILIDMEEKPYSRKWNIQGLSINTPRGNLILDGSGTLNDNGIEGNNNLKFGEDSVDIKGHALNDGKKASLKLAVSPSQFKDASFDILLEQTKTGNINSKLDYENKLQVTHGPDPNNKESRISIVNSFSRDSGAQSVALSSQVTYPLFQVDGKVNFAVKPKSIVAGVRAQADKYKGGLQVKGELDTKKPGDYNLVIVAEAMDNALSLDATRKVIKPTQSKFTNVLEIKPGGKYELNANVNHNVAGNNIDVVVDAEAKLPVEPKSLAINAALKSQKSESKASLKASAGGKTYIDADGHIKKTDKPSGGYKLKLLGFVDTNGDFSYDGSNLKAKAKLDLVKVDKKAEGKADLVVKENKVAGLIDLCWDTKNPAKSLKIQTDSARLTGDFEGISSKNTITYENSKTFLNGKFQITRKDLKTGKVPDKASSSGELEVVLPSGYKVVGKGSNSWDVPGGHSEALYGLTVEEPGKGPREVSVKVTGKNLDWNPVKFDTQVTLSYLTPGKKDAILHAILKKVPKDGGKWVIKGEVGSSGSLIEKPLTVKLDSEISEKLVEGKILNDDKTVPPVNYKFSLTLGKDVSVDSNGKIAGNTVAGDLTAKLPEGTTIKSLKYSTNNIIDIKGVGKPNKIKTNQQLSWNEDNFIKAELEGSCEDSGLRYSAEWETNALSKRKLTGAAHWSSNEGMNADASANLAWEGKTADLSAKINSNKDGSVIGAHATANTPDYGKSDVAFKNKIIKEGKGVHTDLSLSNGDKKVVAVSKIEMDKEHPLVDINVDHPKGQSKLFFKNDKKGPNHWTTEFKAKWSNNGGIITVQNDVNLDNIDNLSIKSNLELPEHKKVDVDINVKDGKKLSFSVQKDGKPYVSGNANYDRKVDGKKKTISGKGQVDIEGKSYPLAYTAVHEELNDGDMFNLDLHAGGRKGSMKIVRLPTDFTWEREYCKEDGKCSKAYIISKITKLGIENTEQTTAVKIDFSIINPKYNDVSYKSTYKRQGLVQDHDIEVQWANSEKIKYNAYVHEKQSGVILALPKRTVGAELHYDMNKKGEKAGNIKIEADLWLNKEKNDKLCFIATTDVSRNKDNTVLTGETKVTHPALKKDLIIKGKASVNDKLGKLEGDVVIDIFRKPNQKIVVAFKAGRNLEGKSYTLHRSGSIKSEGCKLNIGYESRAVINSDNLILTWSEKASYVDASGAKREFGAEFEATPKKIVAKLNAPEGILGELDVNIDQQKKEVSWLATASVAGLKYKENLKYNLAENHLLNTISLDGKTIQIEAGALIGKSGVLKLTLDNKPAAELDVALDEPNFLKSKYNYDVETLKAVWQTIASSAAKALRALDKKLVDSLNKNREEVTKIIDCLGDSIPDFSAAGKHIKEQLKQVKDELLSEPTLSEIGKTLKESLGKAAGSIGDIIEEIGKFINTMYSLAQEAIKKGGELWKELSPKVQESIKRISNLLVEVAEEVVQLSIKISDAVLNELKKHEADIKEYLKALTDFIHEFGKQFGKVAFAIQEELKKFTEGALEQLKELPIIAVIKEKLAELKTLDVPKEAWDVYNELVDGLITILPTPECEEFVQAASGYLVKLLKREEFNTEQATKELATKGDAAVRSLAKRLSELIPKQATSWKPNKLWSLPLNKWVRIPTGGLRISAINWILSRDAPTVFELISAYVPNLQDPLDNLPPFKGVGISLGGDKVLTFDGTLLYLPAGKCSYVLAEDYVDGNFSVSAELSGTWHLQTITVVSGKDSISLAHEGQPLVNGKPTDFPIRSGDLSAWWRPYGVILRSKAGVKILCDHQLSICQVDVNGFYFNRIRGLLGNLNYEPADDLLQPNGELATDGNALATAWKTNPACAAGSSAPLAATPAKECVDLFGKNPELLIGRPWADTKQWRQMCDHALANAPANMKQEIACSISKAYVWFARTKGAFFLRVPQDCAICRLGDKIIKEWSTVKVDVGKAADIVLVVETTDDNKDTWDNLVTPLLAALKPELEKNGCRDIKTSVVSFSPSSRWPEFHTSKGAPNYDGKTINLEWTPRPVDKNVTTEDKVNWALATATRETGMTSLAKAYEDVAMQFEFRPHAAKTIIGVHGKPCHSPLNPIVPAKVILGTLLTELRGASYNLIIPVGDLEMDGVKAGDIVGFNADKAITIDGKTHKGEVQYDRDYCVDSAEVTGNVIPANNWKAAQAAGKGGEFIKLTAQKLAKTIAKDKDDDLNCHCSLVNGLHPQVRCIVEDLLEDDDD